MDEYNSNQDKILYQIKRLGPQTARTLADALGVTTMGVRQHLQQLEDAGAVVSLPEKIQPRGRPVKSWALTEKGHGRFPDAHAQISADLIASVRDVLGEDAIDAVIEKRTTDTLAHYRSAVDKRIRLRDKVKALVDLRTKEGYMAEIEKVGAQEYVLIEHHCPICIAAKACQGFCRSELEVFQTLFSGIATVEREDHLLSGARRCSYRIAALK